MKVFILKILMVMAAAIILFSSAVSAQAAFGKGTPAPTLKSENGKLDIIVIDSVIKPNPANANTESGTGLKPDKPVIIEPGDNFKPSAKGQVQTPPQTGASSIEPGDTFRPIR